MIHPHTLAVVGTGHVGSYVLADAMKTQLFGRIITIDTAPGVAHGEALDQHHATGLPTLPAIDVHAGDWADCADADVVICAAGPSIIPDGSSRMPDRAELAATNAATIRDVMGNISKYTRDAIIILITNPLDTMVYIAENEFDYPAGRVFGTGTMLDSARLRRIIADRVGVSPASISGYMMGEHGLSALPVLSHTTVGGLAIDEVRRFCPEANLDPDSLKDATVQAAYEVLNSKGWTNAGVAQAAITLAKHVLLDEHALVPVCTTLRGEYGYDGDVALSIPSLVTKDGVSRRYEISLNEWETEKLHASVAAIQDAMKAAGCK